MCNKCLNGTSSGGIFKHYSSVILELLSFLNLFAASLKHSEVIFEVPKSRLWFPPLVLCFNRLSSKTGMSSWSTTGAWRRPWCSPGWWPFSSPSWASCGVAAGARASGGPSPCPGKRKEHPGSQFASVMQSWIKSLNPKKIPSNLLVNQVIVQACRCIHWLLLYVIKRSRKLENSKFWVLKILGSFDWLILRL